MAAKKTSATKTKSPPPSAAAKPANSAKSATPKKASSKASPVKSSGVKAKATKAPSKPQPRADFGAPVDGFFAKQPAHLRPIVDGLRRLVEEVVPNAEASLKWGMPFYSLDGAMLCAIGAHKAHVNLILSGPPGTFSDPEGLLVGDGKTGRHLKLVSIDELPHTAVKGWLKAAVSLAQGKK